MRRVSTLAAVALVLPLAACGGGSEEAPTQPEDTAVLLGQSTPGLTAKPFAPGVVTTDDLEISGTFAPGMQEFYFTRQSPGTQPTTYVVRYEDGAWQEPVPIDEDVGSFSPDGNTIFLGNEVRQRTDSGWSESKSLGPEFEDFPIMRLTVSDAGTYVFDVREEIGTLRYSRLVDGERQEPQPFNDDINSGRWTAHPFIAPDESYLIWDSEREGGYGETDLYISFRQEDGSWGPAINMGAEINSEYEDGGGTVTPDGKYFFFGRVNLSDEGISESEANIYWIDARLIEELRSQQ